MDLAAIKQWIADRDMQAIETAWLEAVEQPAPPAELQEALEAAVSAGLTELAETLAWMLLSESAEGRSIGPEQGLAVARAILPALAGSDDLRLVAADLYRQAHGQDEHFDAVLRASGLEGDQTLRRAVATLETCLAIRSGTYVANRFDETVLRATGYNAASGLYELAGPRGEQAELEPKLLADEFDRAADDDFRVLIRFNRPRLAELLADDPAAVLVGVCLARGGRVEAPALMELLVPAHLEAGRWSKWWTRARAAAKRSESLSVTGRPAVVSYHPGGRNLTDELAEDLKQATGPMDYFAVLQRYAREAGARKQPIDAGFVAPIMRALADQGESLRARRGDEALAALLAIETAAALGLPGPEGPYVTAREALAAMDRPAEVIAALPDAALWPAALDALARREDAAGQFARLMLLMPAGQLDEVARRLRACGDGEAVARAVGEALAEAAANLQVCLWLWTGPAEAVEGAGSPLEQLSRLLGVMERLARDSEMSRKQRGAAFAQIRAAMLAGDSAAFRAAVDEMDQGVAETIRRRVERSEALSPTSREKLLGILRVKFPAMFLEAQVEPWLDESVVWTTAESLGRREAQLTELLDVKMPANARAIGEAAKHGDLSDNSEWQFAIEEKRRLGAQAAQMQDELARSRVLRGEDVPAETVGVGSRVVVRRLADGQTFELTFLGPWESDVDNRVYSYKTPVALALMGKSPGETVTVKIDGEEGQCLIEATGSALAGEGGHAG